MGSQSSEVKLETQQPQGVSEAEEASIEESDGLFVSDDDEEIFESGLYSEESEQYPKSAAYDEELHQVSKDIRGIISGASEALGVCDPEHPRYKVVFDTISKLMNDPTAPKRRINIVGTSGVGKSSLLNSSLGRPEAAKANGAGKACTQVPTSYESPFPGQVKPFAAKIEPFTTAELKKKFDAMLRDYNVFYSDENKDWPSDELAKIKSDADTAFQTFRTLFCQTDEFLSKEAGHDFLRKANEVPRGATVRLFVTWCDELQAERCPELQDPSSFFEADTQQDLLDYLEQFALSSSRYEEPAMWPLVKMIRQGLRVEILRHATITDWPGSGDTNSLRANASAERIFDCDEIWIVSAASRISTDSTVRKNLLRYSSTIKCVLICTCIDLDLDDNLAAEIQRHGYDIGKYKDLRAEEKALERSIAIDVKKIQTYEDALRKGRNKRQKLSNEGKTGVQVKKAKLEDALEDAQKKYEKVSQDCFEALIAARKVFVWGELKEGLSSDNILAEKLCMHFVANTHYNAHKGGKKVAGPLLSPEATGIPALRAHILEAAAPQIMSTLQDHLDHEVTVFLQGINLLVSPANLRGCQDALNMVSAKQTRVRPFLAAYQQLVEAGIDEDLVAPLKKDQDEFVAAASTCLEEKKKWSYPTIGAFVRKDGCHTTEKVGYHSWTDELLKKAADQILHHFPHVVIVEEEAFKCLEAKLIAECEDIAGKMKETAAGFVLPMDRFEEFIKGHVQGVKQLCQTYRTEVAMDFGAIKIESTQADEQCPTGYFKVAMQEAWDSCKEFSGTGTKARIMTTLETYIKLKAERSPFAMLADSIKAHIIDDTADLRKDLMVGMDSILQDIRNWLEAMFHEEFEASEEAELRHRLKTYVEKAILQLEKIKVTLKMIEQKYEHDE